MVLGVPMSKSKHTPGPWSVRYGQIFMECEKPNGHTYSKTLRLTKANARLISAAPDMYEALEALIKACSEAPGEGPLDELNQAVKAINKAIGE